MSTNGMDSTLQRLLRGSLLGLFVLVPLVIVYQAFFPTLVKDVVFVGVVSLCSLGWLWLTLVEDRYVIPLSALNLVLAGNIAVWLASFAASAFPREAYAPLAARLAGIGLLLLAPAMLASRRRVIVALGLLVATATVMSIYGILQFFHLDPFVRTEGLVGHFRVSSTTDHPNIFMSFLVGAVPVNLAAIVIARASRARVKALLLLALVLNIGAAAATLSRAGWGALVAALLVFALVLRFAKSRGTAGAEPLAPAPAGAPSWLLRAALPVALAAGAGLLLVSSGRMDPGERERLLSLTGPTTQRRLLIYESALRMAEDSPLLGKGVGTFSLYLPAYRRTELARFFPRNDYQVEHSVSEPLEVLAESGILGLAFWILLVGALVLRPISALRRTSDPALRAILAAAAAGTLGIALHSLVEVSLRFEPPFFLFFALPGLALAAEASALAQPTARRSLSIPTWPSRLVLAVVFGMTFGLAFAYTLSDFVANYYVTLGRKAIDRASLSPAAERPALLAASSELRSALAAWSGNLPARYRLAYCEWRLGHLSQAEADYREVIRQSPYYFDVNHNLARVLLEKGRVDEAFRFAEKAIRLNPFHAPSGDLYVQLALGRRRVTEAEQAATKLLQLSPEDPGSLIAMARVRLAQGRRAEARRLLLEARRLDPRRREVRVLLGRLQRAP